LLVGLAFVKSEPPELILVPLLWRWNILSTVSHSGEADVESAAALKERGYKHENASKM